VSIETRGVSPSEYPAVGRVILSAFKEDEFDLWEYLVAHDPAVEPDGVRVATAGGKIVACTVVVPRQIRTRAGWAPGAAITLVCCDPAFQGRGYGGATVRSAVDYCRARGLALGLLYGIPEFYPRYGFVPVLPRLSTELSAERVADSFRPLALVPMSPGDIPDVTAMYHETLGSCALAVRRGTGEWLWRYRSPKAGWNLLVARGGQADLIAYARLETDLREPGAALVREAGVRAGPEAVGLLCALAARALNQGLGRLRLVLPPREPLVRAALLLGAEQRYRPATSGMAVVTSWQAVLPEGYSVETGFQPGSLLLRHADRPLLGAGPRLMTQMVLGYRAAADLLMLPDVDRLGTRDDEEELARSFPRLYPCWTEAPFWW